MADAGLEPSMEDILSSIKRIIAEDSDQALSAPRQKRAVGLATAPAAIAPDDHADDDDHDQREILELTEAMPEPTATRIETPAPKNEARQAAEQPDAKAALASTKTIDASRSSLAVLSALIVKPEIHGGDTLEGLVREMLKPMLAEWLDARLPDLVDGLVKQEIARITARS